MRIVHSLYPFLNQNQQKSSEKIYLAYFVLSFSLLWADILQDEGFCFFVFKIKVQAFHYQEFDSKILINFK